MPCFPLMDTYQAIYLWDNLSYFDDIREVHSKDYIPLTSGMIPIHLDIVCMPAAACLCYTIHLDKHAKNNSEKGVEEQKEKK